MHVMEIKRTDTVAFDVTIEPILEKEKRRCRPLLELRFFKSEPNSLLLCSDEILFSI